MSNISIDFDILKHKMSPLEHLTKRIEGKLKALKFTHDDSSRVLKENKVKTLEYHAKVLEDLVEETHNFKVEIQQKRIEKRYLPETGRKWRLGIEAEMGSYESVIDNLKEIISGENAYLKNREEKKEEIV